ncbi:MAG: alpha/beta fold hydrolase [Spirochaetes bacterium]|nr:alpha/beta fold hydrolase [Spirochaetota bacterium]
MWKKIVVAALVLIAAALFAAAWYFSSLLVSPAVKPCPADHFVYCKGPSELNLPYQEVSFKSRDGLTLRGWFMPAGKSDRAVLFVHGHGASRYEGLRWVKALHKAGFATMVFDLRNCGQSDRAPVSMGYHEKDDVIAAVDYLYAVKGIKKIGLFGVSMGSASGILAMARDKRIAAGVFEAGYADFRDLIVRVAKRDFGLPRFPLVDLTFLLFDLRTGADSRAISPERVIGSISPRPVFIMHCKEDNYVPYDHGERLFRKAREPKEMWTHKCAHHAEAWQADPPYIEKRVADYFSARVR